MPIINFWFFSISFLSLNVTFPAFPPSPDCKMHLGPAPFDLQYGQTFDFQLPSLIGPQAKNGMALCAFTMLSLIYKYITDCLSRRSQFSSCISAYENAKLSAQVHRSRVALLEESSIEAVSNDERIGYVQRSALLLTKQLIRGESIAAPPAAVSTTADLPGLP
jgi:hypothetical protein